MSSVQVGRWIKTLRSVLSCKRDEGIQKTHGKFGSKAAEKKYFPHPSYVGNEDSGGRKTTTGEDGETEVGPTRAEDVS